MTRLGALGAIVLLFLQVARCDNLLVPRDAALGPGEVEAIPDIKYSPETGSVPLSGRELVSDWLNPGSISKRACVDAGYEACSDSGCCPSAERCCPASPYCKRASTDSCCWSLGTCPSGYFCHVRCECVATGGTCCSNGRYCESGYKCCSLGGCAPVGGQCCSNGQICGAGNICVTQRSTGRYGCCTDLSCTAYVSSGSTISLTRTTTTAPPRTTQRPQVYRYYYYTITWYYYLYYFTYYYQIEMSTLTSTKVTTTTILSVYDNDADDATASLSSLSREASRAGFPTPASATTALALSTDRIGPGSTLNLPSATPPSVIGPSGDGGGSGGSGVVSNGDLPGTGSTQTSLPARALVWGLVAGVAAVGAGMVLL